MCLCLCLCVCVCLGLRVCVHSVSAGGKIAGAVSNFPGGSDILNVKLQ